MRPIIVAVSGVLLIGILIISIFIGTGATSAKQSPYSPSDLTRAAESAQSTSPQDLKQAAEEVDEAAADVYSGLDKTKDIIGKTDARKQAIEHGRDNVSNKLESLSDRVEEAAQQNKPLNPSDQRAVEHLTAGPK